MRRGKALSAPSTAQMVIVTLLAELYIWSRRAMLYLSYLQADISAAVDPNEGALLVPNFPRGMFCCGNFDPANNSCLTSTHGSSRPFEIGSAMVINNRTSGSVTPNSTETTTVVVTSTVTALSESATTGTTLNDTTTTNTETATAATACSKSSHIASSSPWSRADIATASSVSALLGLALLVTLGFFWRLRKQRQKLSKAVEEWKVKYSGLMEPQAATVGGVGHQKPQQLHGCHTGELEGQSRLPAQLEC